MGYLCWINVSHREIQQLIRPYQHFGKLCRGIVNWFMPLVALYHRVLQLHRLNGQPYCFWKYAAMVHSYIKHDDNYKEILYRIGQML